MVQTAKDRLGADHVGLFAAMARSGLLVIAIGGRRIGNTRAQRHVRTSSIVMRNPHSQNGSQMRLGQRNQPIQTLAPYRTDDAFADRIGLGTARRRFQHPDSESFH